MGLHYMYCELLCPGTLRSTTVHTVTNTQDATETGIAPGTLCPGHMHVPWAHYTISLVKECRFVVKGCRFASVREKCMCYIWVGSSSIWEIGKKEDKKEDHFWREHLPHRASRAPSQHVRALARMSDDIGPLRPAGERKVFHDRHGHVAGAMSAQAAFAAPPSTSSAGCITSVSCVSAS